MSAHLKVLMLGPARSVRGGVSGVVNNMYSAGLDQAVDLKYIGTMVDGSKLRKLLQAAIAYIQAILCINNFDIVHINVAADASYYRKLFLMKLALRKHKKLVIHQHGGDVDRFYGHDLHGHARDTMVKVFNSCDAFIVLTSEAKDFFSAFIHDTSKISVIPNGITIPDINLAEKDYCSHDILFLGRICRDKGVYELLEAVKMISPKYPDIHLHIGGIYEDPSLEEMINADPQHITYEGWVDDTKRDLLLRSCQILALPSYFEGFGLAALEGMAYGCGVIASDVGGLGLLIHDQKDGLLIPPKDSRSLAASIDRLFSDSMLCQELGRNASITAKQYDIRTMVDTIVNIYEKVSLSNTTP